MATTTRSKYRQAEAAAAAARENILVQEEIDESESNSNYEYETNVSFDKSFITIQEISDNNIVSDISDLGIIIDEFNKKSSSKKERKPPTKITKPKTNWDGNSLNLMMKILKLFVKLMVVKQCLYGVVPQVQ